MAEEVLGGGVVAAGTGWVETIEGEAIGASLLTDLPPGQVCWRDSYLDVDIGILDTFLSMEIVRRWTGAG